MHLSRIMRLALLGFSLLPAGCAGGRDDDPMDEISAPRTEPLTGGGGGENGLPTTFFHASKYYLLAAAGMDLPGQGEPLSDSLHMLINTPEGDKTLEYAIRCALGDTSVSYLDENSVVKTYSGGDLLDSTQGWTTNSLSAAATEDLFACMLAHLNPLGEKVPISLTGEAVVPSEEEDFDLLDYPFQEALWAADVGAVGATGLTFHVWPMGDLNLLCGQQTVSALVTRTCGLDPEGCNLTVHTDLDDCVGGNGVYDCTVGSKQLRAIQTWRKPGDIGTLYPVRDPGCAVRDPGCAIRTALAFPPAGSREDVYLTTWGAWYEGC